MTPDPICLCCNRRESRIDHPRVGPVHLRGRTREQAKALAARTRALTSWYVPS
jgi:hypothetical protein